ncbi:hypothetical protein KPL71_012970 [Citrus sinensis]|uniref:Uncharacterized protein n=1 Tax=Citrus sinensis TaxID=2711 RepID=A0ACB8LFP7_CITSI|nr:hypothetical protein KPL71_012970 [Citrus sinensis]
MKMRGEGGLRDHSLPKTWPRKRTLNGCERKRNLDNVVLIDVDSERLDNVILIDVPESLQHKIGSSSARMKGKKFQFRGIISIDDDEDVGCSEMDSDSSSSKSCPAPDHANKFEDLGDDECRVVKERNYAFGISKCKQASDKYPCSNRYGLFESSSSDTDGSDCEVMEGSFGKLHKEWEKAYLKRKFHVHQGKAGVQDQASPSSLNNDPRPDVDVEAGKSSEERSKTSFCCNSSNAGYKSQNSHPFVPTDDTNLDTASLNPGMERPSVQSDKKVGQEINSSSKEADFQFRRETVMEDPFSFSSWWQSYKHKNNGSGSSFLDGQSPPRPFFWYNRGEEDKQHHHTSETHDKNTSFQGVNQNFQHKNTSFQDKEASLCKSQQSSERHDNTEQVVPSENYKEFSQATSSCTSSPGKSHRTRTVFMEKAISGDPPVSSSQPSCDKRAECSVASSECNAGAIFEESVSFKIPSSGMPEVCNDKSGQQDAEKPDSEGISSCETQCADRESKQERPCSTEVKQQVIGSMSNYQLDAGADVRRTQGVSLTSAFADDIINEREKLKETDEYKRAMEEEWASRQRQLQIQAEEAQRLRKKKRAESMRLLDMERRQKQRLEEIRETQKKDEENMNLKEKIRIEVRKELCKLETTCIDMASLLRALGIHVGGSFRPLSQEVS